MGTPLSAYLRPDPSGSGNYIDTRTGMPVDPRTALAVLGSAATVASPGQVSPAMQSVSARAAGPIVRAAQRRKYFAHVHAFAPLLAGGINTESVITIDGDSSFEIHKIAVLAEPTTGLHLADIERLLVSLNALVLRNGDAIR